jgi:hypothetical protein
MSARAPLLSFVVGIGIVLAGTAFGLRQDSPAAASLTATASDQASAAVLPAPVIGEPVSAVAPAVAAVGPAVTAADALPTPKEAPATAVFPEMKHVWQSLNNCGPAAVVMALSTFGVDANQEVARLALRGADVRRGMGPQGVDPWVKENFGLRSMWRNNGTNDLMRRLVANGFAPMVTQWMQDPSVSRIAHWRTIRGYDDAAGLFYVNDSMLGNKVALSYDWFGRNWQSFSYRYMVIYRPEDERLLQAVIGKDWSEAIARQSLYERTRSDALAQNTTFAWLAYGEAAYANGVFDEAVAAFEKGFNSGSATGVFGVRNSYPQALRALGRKQEADAMTQKLTGITPVPSTVAPAPDSYAMFLAIRRSTPFEQLPTE